MTSPHPDLTPESVQGRRKTPTEPAFRTLSLPHPLPTLADDSRPTVQRVREVLAVWQAGRCAVCDGRLGDQPIVDHDHVTNRVRGLLCASCNTREGIDRDDPVLAAYRAAPPTALLQLDVAYEDGAPVWLDTGDGPPLGSVLTENSPWWERHAEAGVPGAYQARAPWRYPDDQGSANEAVRRLLYGTNLRDRDAVRILRHMAARPGLVTSGIELAELCDGPVHAAWAATADAVGTRRGAPPLHRKWNVAGSQGGVRYALRPSTCALLIDAGLQVPDDVPATERRTTEISGVSPRRRTKAPSTPPLPSTGGVDDAAQGAFVPRSRAQLAEFEAPAALVTLDDGTTVAVRRHRGALNNMRRVPTGLPVRWGVEAKGWARWRDHVHPSDERETKLVASLDADAQAGRSSVGLETSDPADLRALSAVLDRARRSLWVKGGRSRGWAKEVAVFVGALAVLADEVDALTTD